MDHLTRETYLGMVRFVVILWVLLFLPAFTLNYWQAWLFWVVSSLCTIVVTLYFLKRDRGLIERRLKAGASAEKEKFQKAIQSAALVLSIASVLIPALDHRFGWSRVPPALSIIGDGLIVVGFWIIFLVFRENSYTAATIDVFDNQRVVSTGPYSIVRHPLYAGAMIMFPGIGLGLGSFWALIAGAGLVLVVVLRLLDEEKFLLENLSGYSDYRRKVRYRLIPFVW